MITVKIERDYYDKVKALADASGQSIAAAMGDTVAAGLGELEGLGEHLKEVTGVGGPQVNEDEAEGAGPGAWVWVAGALLALIAVKQKALMRNNM